MIKEMDVVEAVDTVSMVTTVVYKDKLTLTNAKQALANAKHKLISNGIEGKNVAERDANLALALKGEQAAVTEAENLLSVSVHELALAQLHWSKIKWLIRLTTAEVRE